MTTLTKAVHDFAGKLRQPSLIGRLKEYVRWQADLRGGRIPDDVSAMPPDYAPVSINLDLTTACNYRCDHCVDMDILNTGIRYDYERLLESLDDLVKRGLKSVILIGGGEPTVFPKFEEVVAFLKERGTQVAVVSNGSGNKKILNCAEHFTEKDWVRYSLDSGTDETFQAMHLPRKKITLEEICAGVPAIKQKNPNFQMGFSFIIVWKGAETNDTKIIENVHEIVPATKLARDSGFDYISLKPFLDRAEENNAEQIGLDDHSTEFDGILARVREEVEKAKELATDSFKVLESTNLRVLEDKTYGEYMRQPTQCHMTFFHGVISPLGIFNCPVYRNVPQAKLGEKHGYADAESTLATRRQTTQNIKTFDASHECRNVVCLYNSANWMIEELIRHPELLEELEPSEERGDFYF